MTTTCFMAPGQKATDLAVSIVDPGADNYVSDFLTNFEAGWKTQWLGNRLQFNGAVFYETWDDFQVSFVGANAITQVANGPTADVTGLETQVHVACLPTICVYPARLPFTTAELQDDYCPGCNADGSAWAPAGTSLPITADFKGNVISRYSFNVGSLRPHWQAALATKVTAVRALTRTTTLFAATCRQTPLST